MWTRQNLINISLAGRINTVKCNCCGQSETFEQSDRFTELARPRVDSHSLKKIKTPKDLIAWFLDEHFDQHVTLPSRQETAVAA